MRTRWGVIVCTAYWIAASSSIRAAPATKAGSAAGTNAAPAKDVALAEAALAEGDVPRAITLFASACGAGDQHACARQGFYLVRDSRDAARVTTALRLWSTACDRAGDPLACANLASLYADGEGVPRDPKYANQLYAKACEHNDNFSCGASALAYGRGMGVDRDLARAFKLADKGCRLDSPSACTVLGLGWAEGWSGTKDLKKAAALFLASCERDDVSGCFQLGLAFRAGRGVPRDAARGRAYLERACRRGIDPEACQRELSLPSGASR
jgi:TPR repeat protein